MSINYKEVISDLRTQLGDRPVTDDPVRRFAWSTDASYFRIVPEVVVHAETLEQVKLTLAVARKHNAPVTFRAAGTSLSGQAIGEGILLTNYLRCRRYWFRRECCASATESQNRPRSSDDCFGKNWRNCC